MDQRLSLYLCIAFAALFLGCRITVRLWHWAGTVSAFALLASWACVFYLWATR